MVTVVAVITVLTVLFPINSVVVFIETFAPTVSVVTEGVNNRSFGSPLTTQKNVALVVGAEVKVIVAALMVYATSGSWSTPLMLTNKFRDDAGYTVVPELFREKTVCAPLNDDAILSIFFVFVVLSLMSGRPRYGI